MRTIALLAIIVLAAAGCKSPQQSTNSTTTEKHDKRDSVVYREKVRLVPVHVKGDSVRVEVKLPCPDTATTGGAVKSGRTTLKYSLKNGVLDMYCAADSLLLEVWARDIEIVKLQNEKQWLAAQTQRIDTVTKTVVKHRVPMWCWVVLMGLLAVIFRKQLLAFVRLVIKQLNPLPWK